MNLLAAAVCDSWVADLAGIALVLCIVVGFVAEERDWIGGAMLWLSGFGGICVVAVVLACD